METFPECCGKFLLSSVLPKSYVNNPDMRRDGCRMCGIFFSIYIDTRLHYWMIDQSEKRSGTSLTTQQLDKGPTGMQMFVFVSLEYYYTEKEAFTCKESTGNI